VSSGIEPVFAYAYTRKVLQPDGSKIEEEVVDHAVQLYRDMFGADAPLPDYFVSAQTLSPQAHVRMQAAAQKWVDSSISKTINCPEDISFDDFRDVYLAAWDSGCKGCTTYRPNAITGSVLSVEPAPKKEDVPGAAIAGAAAPAAEARPATLDQPMPRADILAGQTYKLKWAGNAYYITVNDIADAQGRRRPFEVFINTKNIEAQSWIAALTLMISAVFRRGGDVSFVAEELKGVFDARGGEWVPGKGYVKSLVAAIGDILERHMQAIGFLEPQVSPEENGVAVRATFNAVFGTGNPTASTVSAGVMLAAPPRGAICPSCAEPTLIKSSGCDQCSCGYSKCS
jgi:ribonucleoside-diphosphate reductase alpha chain